jgi:hypothetical protein
MYMRITWGKTVTAGWMETLPPDLLDLSRFKPQGLQSRWVARDAADPENYYSVTVFDTLENLDGWENSRAYLEDYLPAVTRHLVGSHSSSVCKIEVGASSLPGAR